MPTTCPNKASATQLQQLLDRFAPEAVEAAIVAKYCHTNQLTPRHNRHLTGLLNHPDTDAATKALHDTRIATTDDLVDAFEHLTAGKVKQTGAVFTPARIANFMARQAIGDNHTPTVLDPACGCGALLVAALKHLHRTNRDERTPTQIVAEQLYGIDIDPANIARTKTLLAVTVLQLGEDPTELHVNTIAADSVLDDWDDRFNISEFDVILGNPPYVRYQNLDRATRQALAQRWETLGRGNYNLYFAFFELAHKHRADGGVAAYITPSNYLRAASAKPLRQWMADHNFPSRIIDFGDTSVFDNAATYTAITISDHRHHNNTLHYIRSDGTNLTRLDTGAQDATYPHTKLDGGVWRLVGKTHATNIANIESAGRPLSELVTFRGGIATLRDNLYLLDGRQNEDGHYIKEHDGETYLIEHAATQPVVRVSDVATQQQLDQNRQRIIFPYTRNGDGVTIWTEDQLSEHPHTRTYLEAIRDELALRDHGRKTYAAWFAYGRTQGLGPTTTKLLSPLHATEPRFLVDTNENRLFLNGISVTAKDTSPVDLEVLEVLLNSKVLGYYIAQTSSPLAGGYYAYNRTALSRFTVPDGLLQRRHELLACFPTEADRLLCDMYNVDIS